MPGITGTALLYLFVTTPRLDDAGRVGGVVRRAGAHTFGIFVGHYAVYLALRETGRLHDLPDGLALAVAAVTAVAFALVASAATWVLAQTLLTSLAGFGERVEAVVSMIAIAVLLLILNWFYHRVYWQQNLQGLHRRKKSILVGAGFSLAAAQVAGLVALGFSSVYREGFETVLFLQALTLDAGAWTVLQGVGLGLAGVALLFWAAVPASGYPAPWAMVVVPLVPIAGAVVCFMVARSKPIENAFDTVKKQLNADMAMLREVSAP